MSIFDALEYIAANQLEAEQNEIRCAIHTMKTALSESNAPDGSFSSQLKPNRNVRTAGQIVVFWVGGEFGFNCEFHTLLVRNFCLWIVAGCLSKHLDVNLMP